jgi:hypothetical protein
VEPASLPSAHRRRFLKHARPVRLLGCFGHRRARLYLRLAADRICGNAASFREVTFCCLSAEDIAVYQGLLREKL